jgi:hypothetical protein
MILYHPVVPFKDPKKIIEHVAKCVEGTKRYFSSVAKNNFRLFNSSNKGQSNNCENFSNGCVLGLNYSELAERRQNKEKSEFCLKEEISRTDCNLDKLTDHFPYNTISKIKDYKENDLATRNEMECSIEVQPKTSVFSDMTREMLKRNYGNMYRG